MVVPTYNMEKYLDKCLSSLIVGEHLEDLEVLVVNDGSKDSSLEIARRYETSHPGTFVVVDKKNGNYGSCINAGLKRASGKYFKVLDADDFFDTACLEAYLAFLKQTDADLIMSDFQILDQTADTRQTIEYDLPVGITFSFDYFAKKDVPYMWMHGVTHLTEKMRRIGYQQQEGISYTDKEFVFYPMAVSKTVAYFPRVIYYYLTGREGQTIDPTVWTKNYWMEAKAVKKLIELYKLHKDEVGEGGRLFMQLQLKLYLSSIYREYLKNSRGKLPIEQLVDFDKWLEGESNELYHIVDGELEVTDFPYIPVWRRYKMHIKRYLVHRFFHRMHYYLTK